MSLYDYRKQIQQLYNDSVYGNIKGDIYTELHELTIDNEFIESVSSDTIKKTVTFDLIESATDKDSNNLILQVKDVIRSFVEKNISNISDDMEEFLNSNLCYDCYLLNEENGSKVIIIQL